MCSPRNGEASTTSSATQATRTTQGIRWTCRATQENIPDSGVMPPVGRRRAVDLRSRWGRDGCRSLRPRSTSRAGTSVRAAAMAIRTTAMPATPMDHRMLVPMSTRPSSATATVSPENSTVRPAVASVVVMHWAMSGSRRPVRRRRRRPSHVDSMSSRLRASSSR